MKLAEARTRIREKANLNAFISLTEEEGVGPVVAVKDLVDVRGTITTGGGIILPPTPAADDAPLVRRMRSHGCVVIGKANLHEWAFGITSSNPHYGFVLNPRDPRRIPGGSSGGSAAAVAAGMCDWAVGTDTGGSIRIPAALCGVVGFKPSLGTVSTEGVIPLSRSLDTVGPLAPDVLSAARALEMMSDLTGLVPTAPAGPDFRLAVPSGWVEGLDDETAAGWAMVSAGLPEIAFPSRSRMGAAALTILLVEAAAYHRRWVEEIPESYGSDVLEMLRRGLEVRATAHLDAIGERDRLCDEVAQAMQGWDAVIIPATACVAPLIGQPRVREPLTRFTRVFNLTGQPVICLPAPIQGLPVGIQVVGHFGEDAQLIQVARMLEVSWARLAVSVNTQSSRRGPA